jgi:1-acyl-sn-glycerol-3-phosphate acyltransferase
VDAADKRPDPATLGRLTPYISGVALTARLVIRCLTRVRIEGAVERIPREGPLIIAVNHLSNADGPVVGGWLTPALGRRIHWLGKREMFRFPFAATILQSGSVHPVDRGAADVEAFRLAQRILEAGNVLLAFPEGTRSPTGGLQRPREGLALLALRTGAPILPVGIAGTDRLWPRGGRPHVGGQVVLRVGEAFTLADVLGEAARDRRQAKRLATDAIMERIAVLLPARHRGVYGTDQAEHARADPIRPTGKPELETDAGSEPPAR